MPVDNHFNFADGEGTWCELLPSFLLVVTPRSCAHCEAATNTKPFSSFFSVFHLGARHSVSKLSRRDKIVDRRGDMISTLQTAAVHYSPAVPMAVQLLQLFSCVKSCSQTCLLLVYLLSLPQLVFFLGVYLLPPDHFLISVAILLCSAANFANFICCAFHQHHLLACFVSLFALTLSFCTPAIAAAMKQLQLASSLAVILSGEVKEKKSCCWPSACGEKNGGDYYNGAV